MNNQELFQHEEIGKGIIKIKGEGKELIIEDRF